jgi:hypothetical protein
VTPEPEWVDLGLPSGLLWAKCNIGATVPELPGLYFSWGDTEGHAAGSGYSFSSTSYNTTPAASIESDLTIENDAARVNMGTPWRMPTDPEIHELIDNCTSVWTTLNGMNGRLFTSNINGSSIFIPAVGFYSGTNRSSFGITSLIWSSTYLSATHAEDLYFNEEQVSPEHSDYRYLGFNIRAVRSA